jgi:hypothetical protein
MTKIGKWLLFTLVFASFSPARASANTFTAASCSASDVQAAVNLANDGDTVLIPPGSSASWPSINSVVITKGIILNGQGCSVNFGLLATGAPLAVYADTAASFFLTGFNFTGSGPQAVLYLQTSISPVTMPYRVYGNTFDDGSPATQGVIISIGGNGPGLIDHNTFTAHRGADEIIHNYGCQSETATACLAADVIPGTSNMVFIENNTFTYNSTDGLFDGTSAIENFYGARTVFRYNTVNNMQFDSHGSAVGPCSGNGSTSHVLEYARWWEIYNNTFNVTNINQSNYTALRGGTGVVFNNLFTGSNTASGLLEFQEDCQSGTWPINNQVGRGINQSTSSPAYAWGNAAPLNVASGSSFVDIGSTLTSCSHSPCDVVNTPSQPVTLTRCESAADVAAGCPVSYTYTPYTYPHPLTGGSNQAPAPPTNLIATVNN